MQANQQSTSTIEQRGEPMSSIAPEKAKRPQFKHPDVKLVDRILRELFPEEANAPRSSDPETSRLEYLEAVAKSLEELLPLDASQVREERLAGAIESWKQLLRSKDFEIEGLKEQIRAHNRWAKAALDG
ncbi:hypothetical protein EWM64_g7891 [Hericium alpestre]|uniref:Uncharacterized protein n=1 Tax=Hericium alpestre TaxID=135208 RepID=A0A4Y9ZPD7_9AGAM|nr:hypothetical protein EWM64_g7891 [Hericium alpestre]